MVRIDAKKEVYREAIKSIADVIRGEESDIPLDLNLISNPSGEVMLYVRKFNNMQIKHRLKDSSEISIEADKERRFVFSSQLLESLINKADSERIQLNFRDTEFEVTVGNRHLTRPLSFDLYLFRDSEFQQPMNLQEFHKIATIDRETLRSGLNMMSEISPAVTLNSKDDQLEISVNDAVQGGGQMAVETHSACRPMISRDFTIRPIVAFLKNLNSDDIVVKMSDNGHLMLESDSETITSQLVLSYRL